MEMIKEIFALLIVLIGIAAVPAFVWIYEDVYIPSKYGSDANVIRLYVNRDVWTTERISASNYWWKEFEPAEITVQKGVPTVLRISSGDVYHGFGINLPGQRIN